LLHAESWKPASGLLGVLGSLCLQNSVFPQFSVQNRSAYLSFNSGRLIKGVVWTDGRTLA
jgi:hypothetical protein